MSIKYMNLVWETDFGSPTKKLIMMSLADNANETGECFPSLNYIAKRCGLGRSTVLINVKALEDDNVLSRVSGDSTTSNKYTIRVGQELTQVRSGPRSGAGRGVGQELDPNHHKNHQVYNKRIPASVLLVIKYFTEHLKLTSEDAQSFYDFYESKGWLVGKSPMKSWEAAARNWKRQSNRFNGASSPAKTKPDYTGPESTAEDEAAYKLANRIT